MDLYIPTDRCRYAEAIDKATKGAGVDQGDDSVSYLLEYIM